MTEQIFGHLPGLLRLGGHIIHKIRIVYRNLEAGLVDFINRL